MSLLGNIFHDVGNWMAGGLGRNGTIILIVVLTALALGIFWQLCKGWIGKKKFVIKWAQIGMILLIVILVLLIISLCTTYYTDPAL